MLQPGASFGKYRIIRLIGRGGMGVVYLAEDTTLGRRIALKVLDRGVTSGGHFESRFIQEARTIAGFQHPNIVPIHALEKNGDELAIDMAYIEGGSLSDALRDRRTTGNEAILWADEVLSALASCHRADTIHRDVKPSNILLDGDERALLSDFGLARIMTDYYAEVISLSNSTGFFLGTPRYAPPEAWDGRAPAPTWDVYSMGAVLFESLTGKPPYQAEAPLVLMRQVLDHPVPRICDTAPTVSEELDDLVFRMLAKEPDDRPTDAGNALEALRDVPEMKRQDKRSDSTVIRIRPSEIARPKTGFSPKTSRLPSWSWRIALVVAACLVFLAAVLLGIKRVAFHREPSPSASPSEKVALQGDIGEAPYRIFDTVSPDAQETWPNHCLMIPCDAPNRWTLLASRTTEIWLMQASQQDADTVLLEGGWGEYTGPSARVFRYGDVNGTGRWLRGDEELAVTLKFTNTQDDTRRSGSYLLKVASPRETDLQYVRRLAGGDYFQPLLYNELIPRHLPWAASLESEFLRRISSRVTVPLLMEGAKSPQVDGQCMEEEWGALPITLREESGVLPASLGPAESRMRMCYDAANLFILIEAPQPVSSPMLTLHLMSRFRVPAHSSPKWSVQFQNSARSAWEYVVGDKASPWDCVWQAAFGAKGRTWIAELQVPFENLDQRTAPTPGTRWRLSAEISAGSAADKTPVAQWGDSESKSLEQGVILVFGG